MKTLNLLLTATLIVLSANCFAGNGPNMTGTYTIGQKAGADFKTIPAAVTALQNNGVSGSVTFKVDKEDYNQGEIISAIQKISVLGNIIFVNADEDNSTASNGSSENGTPATSK
jgi:uncharacterized protein YccT (UPF0319 family)